MTTIARKAGRRRLHMSDLAPIPGLPVFNAFFLLPTMLAAGAILAAHGLFEDMMERFKARP